MATRALAASICARIWSGVASLTCFSAAMCSLASAALSMLLACASVALRPTLNEKAPAEPFPPVSFLDMRKEGDWRPDAPGPVGEALPLALFLEGR